ncbi:MAG: SulP family inorganic anion transporter [Gammaproteobacteria bacterium]
MLKKLLPFLRWFPLKADDLRADLIAGISIAMILVPQSMAYANLAGLPVVYGLYASFLPVIIASMWGASRFLHTGPVAMLSLMSAAAVEPLATRGGEEFIEISLLLALMVGILRLLLGLFKMGVLINLAAHPVIVGFTNAAALIIGLSLLNGFLGVPMPRSDSFLADLAQVFQQLPQAHLLTLAFAIGTLIALKLLRQHLPKFPGVLIVVVIGIVISAAISFENKVAVSPAQIADAEAGRIYASLLGNQQKLEAVKHKQKLVVQKLEHVDLGGNTAVDLKSELYHLQGEEKILKLNIYRDQVLAHQQTLVPQQTDEGTVVYVAAEGSPMFSNVYRLAGFDDGQYRLSAGGAVVGAIPSGLPAFKVPLLDFGLISELFATAFIIALIGFMEATSISRALAAKSREKLDPNQELIGQGLANIVGSFFQSYVVSGSFSRSAVAARVGAHTGMYAIISAFGVVLVMLFLTEYLYHLPKAILAAIVMSAVFSLIDFKSMLHAWRVRKADGIAGMVTFAATLIMAPRLADGVVIGVVVSILLFLASTMKPRSAVLGRAPNGTLAGAASHDLAPISENFVVMRFDASLVFINVAHFETAIMSALSHFPDAKAILVIGQGINRMDASGEEKLRALVGDLKAAGVTLVLAGLKKQVVEALDRARLNEVIGRENIFSNKTRAIRILQDRYDAVDSQTQQEAGKKVG